MPIDPGSGLDGGALMDGVPLIDHHCHGVDSADLDRESFEALATESNWSAPAGTTTFDSQLGFAIRRWCAPVLDLEPHASPEAYLEQRSRLGAGNVNRLLISASRITTFLVDAGIRDDSLTSPEQTAGLGGGTSREIVRLERLAEQVAEQGATPSSFIADFELALETAAKDAAGLKSIAAYRYGLDFEPAAPSDREVREAMGRWLGRQKPEAGGRRLDEPVLLRHILWAGLKLRKPIQFHVGYGDADVDLLRCSPLQLTGWLRATLDSGVPMMLLHCYPYQREAGYLAQIFPHVYVDVGLAVNHTGSRSEAVIADSLELTPFHKALFSTDALGLAELYFLGAGLFRRGLARAIAQWINDGDWSRRDGERVARMIGYENAARVYGIEP